MEMQVSSVSGRQELLLNIGGAGRRITVAGSSPDVFFDVDITHSSGHHIHTDRFHNGQTVSFVPNPNPVISTFRRYFIGSSSGTGWVKLRVHY